MFFGYFFVFLEQKGLDSGYGRGIIIKIGTDLKTRWDFGSVVIIFPESKGARFTS